MRTLITFLFAFGMITPTFAGILNNATREMTGFKTVRKKSRDLFAAPWRSILR